MEYFFHRKSTRNKNIEKFGLKDLPIPFPRILERACPFKGEKSNLCSSFLFIHEVEKLCILRVPTVVGRGARVPHHRRERADLLQNSTARIKYRKNGYSIHMHAIAGPAAKVMQAHGRE